MSENKNKTFNVLPGISMGVVTTEYLEKLTEIARKHDIPFFKITSAQRLAIVGHEPETAEQIWQELGQKTGPKKPVGIQYIQSCPGVNGASTAARIPWPWETSWKRPLVNCRYRPGPRWAYQAAL